MLNSEILKKDHIYGDDDHFLTNGKDPIVGKFCRQYVRERLEMDGYSHPFVSRGHSDFEVSDAYHLMDQSQRRDWDCRVPNRSNGTHTKSHRSKETHFDIDDSNGIRFTYPETHDFDLVGLKDFNGNHRLQRALENRSESEGDRPFFPDKNLGCNWLPLSEKYRRQHSEGSRDHQFPDEISSFLVQHPATSDRLRSTEPGLASIPFPAGPRDRTGPTRQQPVSPHKGSHLDHYRGPQTVVSQGQVVSIQVQPVGRGSDSSSEGDSGRESRIINAQLTRREFGFGCLLTFENNEEVFEEDVSTLPAFQTVLTRSSTKDSGIHVSEIDEQNVSPLSPLPFLDSPFEVMRQEERRSGVTERRHGHRDRDPSQGKSPAKPSGAGATVFLSDPHRRATAGYSWITELSRPLTSTPRDEQNRIRHKDKAPGLGRVRSVSEHRFDADMKIPVADGAHERRNRWYKGMGDGRASPKLSTEKKRGGERHSLEEQVGQHEENSAARDIRNREKKKQKKLRDFAKDGKKLNVEVAAVNAEVEKGKNRESYEGKVRGCGKHRRTCDDLESVEHPSNDLEQLVRFTRKHSSEDHTTNNGRTDKRNQNNPKPVIALERLPNGLYMDSSIRQQRQHFLRNQHEPHSSRGNRNLEVGANNSTHGTEGPSWVRIVPRDPNTDEPDKPKSRNTKRKDAKENSRRKSLPSLTAFGCCGSDNVEVLDHGRPLEGVGSGGNGDLVTEASSGVGADGELLRPVSVSACVTELSAFFDGISNVEFVETDRSAAEHSRNASSTNDHSPRAEPHLDDQLKKEFGLKSPCLAMESPKCLQAKLNPVKLPEVLKFPIAVGATDTSFGAVQTPTSLKNPRNSNSNSTDLIPVLPPPPGFGDEAPSCSPVPPITPQTAVSIAPQTAVSVEKKNPPLPPPKLKPRLAVSLFQKKNVQLYPETLKMQPGKLPWFRNKPSPVVPSKVPLPTPSGLQIVSTGTECNNQNKLNRDDTNEPPEATDIAKAPDRDPDLAQNKQVKNDNGKEINFVMMAEKYRKNYINTKVDGNTAITEGHHVHEAGSTIQNVLEALQTRKHESEEKAVAQNAVNKPEEMPRSRLKSTAMPTVPTKPKNVPTGAKAEASVTADLPNRLSVEADLPKEEARINIKQEPGLTPDDNRIPGTCFQVPFCLPAPPGFGDSTETIADRRDLSHSSVSSRSPSSVQVDSDSTPLVNSGRYLTCPIDAWTAEDVGEWLEGLGLGEHRYRFVRHSIDGTKLKVLDRSALVSLEMTNHLHRMHLERARMAQLKQPQEQSV